MTEFLSAMIEGDFGRVLTSSISRRILGSTYQDSQLSVSERIEKGLVHFVEECEQQEENLLRSVDKNRRIRKKTPG